MDALSINISSFKEQATVGNSALESSLLSQGFSRNPAFISTGDCIELVPVTNAVIKNTDGLLHETGNDTTRKSETILQVQTIDVLICGTCTFHCSDIKDFIIHKETCQRDRKFMPGKMAVSSSASQHIYVTTMEDFPNHNAQVPFTSVTDFGTGCKTVPSECTGSQPSLRPEGDKLLYETYTDLPTYLIEKSDNLINITSEDITIDGENEAPSVLMLSEEPNWKNELEQAKKISLAERTNEKDVANFLAGQMASQNMSKSDEEIVTNSRVNTSNGCEVLKSNLEIPFTVNVKPQSTINLVNDTTKTITIQNMEEDTISDIPNSKKSSVWKNYSLVEGILKCSYSDCAFTTKHRKNMTRHYSIHTGEKPFSCEICGQKFTRRDKQKAHEKLHGNEKAHACPVPGCKFRSVHKNGLSKHGRTHTNEKPHHCQLCTYSAKDSSQLSVHLRIHTGDTPFHCQHDGCSATFKSSSNLKRHEIIHSGFTPFKCAHCSYAGNVKHNLTAHIRYCHSGKDKLNCLICDIKCIDRKQLKEHRKTHKARRKNTLPRRNKVTKEVTACNFVCKECNSTFVRSDSYNSHMRQHQMTKGRETPCDTVKFTQARTLIIREGNFNYAKVNATGEANQVKVEQTHPKTEPMFDQCVVTVDGIPMTYTNQKSVASNYSL